MHARLIQIGKKEVFPSGQTPEKTKTRFAKRMSLQALLLEFWTSTGLGSLPSHFILPDRFFETTAVGSYLSMARANSLIISFQENDLLAQLDLFSLYPLLCSRILFSATDGKAIRSPKAILTQDTMTGREFDREIDSHECGEELPAGAKRLNVQKCGGRAVTNHTEEMP